MTQLDVLYRYGAQPSEPATLAIARVREVYGVPQAHPRRVRPHHSRVGNTTLLASREPVIHQLLRRAGLDIVEALPYVFNPPPAATASRAISRRLTCLHPYFSIASTTRARSSAG